MYPILFKNRREYVIVWVFFVKLAADSNEQCEYKSLPFWILITCPVENKQQAEQWSIVIIGNLSAFFLHIQLFFI